MKDSASVLGLANTEVRHALAHEAWAAAFEEEAQALAEALGDAALDIQHVGSTAVPGLIAKPILDLILAVSDLDAASEMMPALASCGWNYRPSGDTEGRRYFVKGPPALRIGHLSLVVSNSPAWNAQVRFRDLLRQRTDVVARYASLKEDLARRYSANRLAYTLGKADFIAQMLSEPRDP